MSNAKPVQSARDLWEACREGVRDLRQALAYFRASAYKGELMEQIEGKIARLRQTCEQVPVDMVHEAFRDYQAEKENALEYYVPGQCSVTARVVRLLSTLEEVLSRGAEKTGDDPQVVPMRDQAAPRAPRGR